MYEVEWKGHRRENYMEERKVAWTRREVQFS